MARGEPGARLGTLASPCWRPRLRVAVLCHCMPTLVSHVVGRIGSGRQKCRRETFCWEEGVRRVL